MEKARAALAPVDRSATTARATTITAPVPSPWSARAASSSQIDSVSAQVRLATTPTAIPPRSTGRRPTWSDSVPHTIWPTAVASRNAVSVSCTCAAVVSRSSAICGNPGR